MNAGAIGKALVAVGKFFALAVAVVIVAFFTTMFFFSPFDWRRCDESHPAVKRMRLLSQEQLGDLYRTVMDLRAQYPDTRFLRDGDPPIPSELEYLKAMRVWTMGPSNDVTITLTKCNVSVGIDLNFSSDAPTIELKWHTYGHENPYATDSEVLWPVGQ